MDKVIEIQNLRKVYGKTLEAIKDLSFNVYEGEIFGILGPNGAGKTTTLEIIECLKQQSSGSVMVLGLSNLKSPTEIKKRIGVQLQSSDYLPYLTLGELLDLFASIYGQQSQKKRLLELVNLTEKEHEQVKNLSGGQKQRFTIATSLVNQPDILFLDEPTTGLDPAARRNLWMLIKKINATGVTIVLTTHYIEEAEYLCHRVGIMDRGRILEIDEPRKLIERLSDTTQLSFLTEQIIDKDLFSKLPGVKKVFADYPKVIVELENLDHISAMVEALKSHHILFNSFTVKTATLEDVYLNLTGREYEE